MSRPARRPYPRKIEITRIVEAAKSCGLDVAGLVISPDGTIRVMEARAVPDPSNDFDKYEHLL